MLCVPICGLCRWIGERGREFSDDGWSQPFREDDLIN